MWASVGLYWLQPMKLALDTSDLTQHGAVTQWFLRAVPLGCMLVVLANTHKCLFHDLSSSDLKLSRMS